MQTAPALMRIRAAVDHLIDPQLAGNADYEGHVVQTFAKDGWLHWRKKNVFLDMILPLKFCVDKKQSSPEEMFTAPSSLTIMVEAMGAGAMAGKICFFLPASNRIRYSVGYW
jgi:hypothetical protein